MTINIDTTTIILFVTYILAIIIGYVLGVVSQGKGVSSSTPRSFFNSQDRSGSQSNISINDSKYVADIKTSGMEKKYTSLGETKTTEENISSSINKLKNMKG